MTPRVSVVMSVYNNERTLARAMESILEQTLRELEFIIIDDGSTDDSPELLAQYAAKDDRIRIIRQQNQGLTKALIVGCQQARADYIARQDADDWSHPERLARQVALLDAASDVGMASCWAEYRGPKDELLEVVQRPADPNLATRQLMNERTGPPAHGTMLFRRELYEQVGGYRPEFYFGQDSDLWLRMGQRAKIAYVPQGLYYWRRDPEAISGAMRPFQRRFGELSQLCRQMRLDGSSEESYLEAACQLTEVIREMRQRSGGRPQGSTISVNYLLGSQLAGRGDRRARGYLWSVVRQRPWHWKAWIRLMQSCLLNSRTEDARRRNR